MRVIKSRLNGGIPKRWHIVGIVLMSGLVTTVTEAATSLSNGVVITVSGKKSKQTMYQISVPVGASNLTFKTSGGSGDVDLYEKYNSLPTLKSGDYKSTGSSSLESISIASPKAGIYYLMLYGYSAYSRVSLVAKYSKVSPSPTPSPSPSPTPSPTVGVRDPLKQPFASTSIWNMPIGSNAVFKPANIPANQDNGNVWATWPGIDEELLFLNPSNPLMPVYFNANAWNGGDRCVASSSSPRKSLPIPTNFYLNGNGNYGAVFLQPDRRTLSQFQPITRCSGYNYATGYMFAPDVDLYGDGIFGTHGGSGLSSFGGSLRVGELRPGQQGPRHALKLNVYAYQVLYKCSGSDCYRWPAAWADSYATQSNGYGHSPDAVNNNNPDMKMGALLAIPRSVSLASLNLQTEPGRQLFFTLQNYGAYIVDDSAAAGIQISVERGSNGNKVDEFQADYGYPMLAKVHDNSPWMHDMQALITHLSVVTNNSSTSIGGGGTPLQPLAPSIAP